MSEYKKASHAVYDIKYHFVWITKYRYKVLEGTIAYRLRELLRQGCEAKGIEIIRREREQRSCAYAAVMSDEPVAKPDHAISKGTLIASYAG